jgi:hypothetical protein
MHDYTTVELKDHDNQEHARWNPLRKLKGELGKTAPLSICESASVMKKLFHVSVLEFDFHP